MPEFVTLNGTGRLGDAGLWVKDHLVPDRESSFDRDCVHRVLSGLGSDFVLRFYRTKADIRTNDSLKKAGIGEECISLALDGTSYDSWSQSLMAGHGKNRSGSDAKIMSLMVLMDRGTGQVFYHQTPAGNIPDIATPESAARHCGYPGNGMLMPVADRGYWSCCNVNACLANGTLFLIHVKLHSVLMRRIITGLGPGLKYGEGCVKIEKNGETNYGIMTEKDWMWLDPEDNQHKTAKIYCYVFFNPELYTSAISRLLDRVTEINALLAGYRKECAEAARKHKKMPPRPELTAEQKKLIDDESIVPDPGTASYRINYVKHDPKLIVEGCRMLASNRRLSVEQAFSDYRRRNAIESLFRDLRNETGLDTVGAQKRVTYEARQFIGVLASELHTEIRACADRYNLKQPVSERLSLKRNSVHATLMELENLEATWDGKTLIPTSNLSKKQAKLYEACGLDPVELKDPRLEIGGPVSPSDEK